jgi:5'(3')-deoxyribonucleotidase
MASELSEQIQRFLSTLDQSHREGFLSYAENTYSVYEIWLYASVLGYEGSFAALHEWVGKTYPKLNRRELMLAEIVKLEADIDYLRQQVHADLVKPDAAATRIAHLSKELRGHVVEIDRMTKGVDRRGLILAGADKVMRELRAIFKGNEEVTNALDLAYESVWTVLIDEK